MGRAGSGANPLHVPDSSRAFPQGGHLGGSDFRDPGRRKAAGPLYTPTLPLTCASPAELPNHRSSVPSDFKWVQHRLCSCGCAEKEALYVGGAGPVSHHGGLWALLPPELVLGSCSGHPPQPTPPPPLPLVHPRMLSEVLTTAIARAGQGGVCAGGRKDIPKQIMHVDRKDPRECLPGSGLLTSWFAWLWALSLCLPVTTPSSMCGHRSMTSVAPPPSPASSRPPYSHHGSSQLFFFGCFCLFWSLP